MSFKLMKDSNNNDSGELDISAFDEAVSLEEAYSNIEYDLDRYSVATDLISITSTSLDKLNAKENISLEEMKNIVSTRNTIYGMLGTPVDKESISLEDETAFGVISLEDKANFLDKLLLEFKKIISMISSRIKKYLTLILTSSKGLKKNIESTKKTLETMSGDITLNEDFYKRISNNIPVMYFDILKNPKDGLEYALKYAKEYKSMGGEKSLSDAIAEMIKNAKDGKIDANELSVVLIGADNTIKELEDDIKKYIKKTNSLNGVTSIAVIDFTGTSVYYTYAFVDGSRDKVYANGTFNVDTVNVEKGTNAIISASDLTSIISSVEDAVDDDLKEFRNKISETIKSNEDTLKSIQDLNSTFTKGEMSKEEVINLTRVIKNVISVDVSVSTNNARCLYNVCKHITNAVSASIKK